ncbi:MAG: type II secretion system F family protein [Candidatus Eisenbacteria bacterium]
MAIDLGRVAAARQAAQEETRAPHLAQVRPSFAHRPLFGARHASLDDLVLLTRQLALLLQSGNGLVPSMAALARQTRSPGLRTVLPQIHARLEEGRTLSSCLEAHPRVFDQLFVSIVRAGEASGELRESLVRLAGILETRKQLQGRVREAMTYPLVLTVIMFAVVVFMMTYLVPRFSHLFEALEDALPWSTRVILATMHLIRSRWWALIPIAILGALGARALLRREAVHRGWDRLKVSLPLIGRLYTEAYLFQLFSAFGLLLGSRVPHLAAIEIVGLTVRNARYADFFEGLARHVEAGRGVSQAFREADFLPETVKLMVATGEMSGTLDTVMAQLSDHYRQELEGDIRRLGTLVEPVMLVIMGLVVGFIATAFILPLFRLSRLVH